MKRIILDTNMLMVPGSLGIDILKEIDRICLFRYELCILEPTLNELEKLAKGKTKTSIQAKLAMALIKHAKMHVIKSEGFVDDLLIEEGENKDTIIATQDQPLKRKLKAQGTATIVLRNKRFLQFLEY